MKYSILTLLLIVSSLTSVLAQKTTWTVDNAHSKLTFTVVHLGLSEVDGVFKDYSATITTTKDDFIDAVFEVSADLTTVSTNNEMRDGHLQKEDMFHTEKYPTLMFKSTSIDKTGEKTFQLTGNLTIKGTTKEVALTVQLLGKGENPMSKKEIAGFKVTGTINRSDFNVGEGIPSMMVSEEIQLIASGEFAKE